jgi:hypothetical protein
LIRINNSQGAARGINPAIKRHLELETKTLQKYTEDPDKLERLLKAKKEKRTKQYTWKIRKKVSYRGD